MKLTRLVGWAKALFAPCPRGPVSGATAWARFALPTLQLEQAGGAHAAADAHGDDGAPGPAPPPFDQNMPGEARSAHAERMADCDRAAIDIEALLRNAKSIATIEH